MCRKQLPWSQSWGQEKSPLTFSEHDYVPHNFPAGLFHGMNRDTQIFLFHPKESCLRGLQIAGREAYTTGHVTGHVTGGIWAPLARMGPEEQWGRARSTLARLHKPQGYYPINPHAVSPPKAPLYKAADYKISRGVVLVTGKSPGDFSSCGRRFCSEQSKLWTLWDADIVCSRNHRLLWIFLWALWTQRAMHLVDMVPKLVTVTPQAAIEAANHRLLSSLQPPAWPQLQKWALRTWKVNLHHGNCKISHELQISRPLRW